VDLETVAGDHHPLDQEAKNRLLGVEIGMEELLSQFSSNFLRTLRPILDDLGLEALASEFRERALCGETLFLDGRHSTAERIQGKGADLVGVGQAIPLTAQLLEASFALPDAAIRIR